MFYLFSDIYILSRKSLILKGVCTITIIILSILLSVTFYNTLNFKQTKEWSYDSHTKDIMMNIYEKNNNNQTIERISISNHWLFTPSINYYRDLLKMDYLTIPKRNGISDDSYYIYNLKNDIETSHLNSNPSYEKIFDYEETVFFQKK